MHVLFLSASFSLPQHFLSFECIWSIYLDFPTDKPSQTSPSHLLTFPLSVIATPPPRLQRPPEVERALFWLELVLHHPHTTSQISSVKWKGLCHNPGIIPPSSGTTMRAVSPAYIIIPDICKIRVMLFFHKLKNLKRMNLKHRPPISCFYPSVAASTTNKGTRTIIWLRPRSSGCVPLSTLGWISILYCTQ